MWSMRTMWYFCSSSFSKASSPLMAVSILILVPLRIPRTRSWFMVLSSTTKILALGATIFWSASIWARRLWLCLLFRLPTKAGSSILWTTQNENVLPFPYSLPICSLLPINSSRFSTIKMPISRFSDWPEEFPTPPALSPSSRSMVSASMPIPVSLTWTDKMPYSPLAPLPRACQRMLSSTYPSDVYFIALLNRLLKICVNLMASPHNPLGSRSSISSLNSRCFSSVLYSA